jgi:hypothetical protein
MPQFCEDRLRMHPANWSWSVGAPMPQSRQERRRIEKEKGIEFVAPHEFPETWKQATDYKKHVDSGGDRLPPEVVAPVTLPKSRTRERIRDWFAQQKEKRKITLR